MFLIQITDSKDSSLVCSIWELDDKYRYAICIFPNRSIYIKNYKLPIEKLGEYKSIRLQKLND